MRLENISINLFLKIEFPHLKSEFKGFCKKLLITYNLAVNFYIRLKLITMDLERCLKTLIFVLGEKCDFLKIFDFKLNNKRKEAFKFHSEELLDRIKKLKNKEFFQKERKKDLFCQKTTEFNIYSMEKKIFVLKKFLNFYKKYIGLILKNPKNISIWNKVRTNSRINKKKFSIFLIMEKKKLFAVKQTIIDKNKINFRKKKLEKRHLKLYFFKILDYLLNI